MGGAERHSAMAMAASSVDSPGIISRVPLAIGALFSTVLPFYPRRRLRGLAVRSGNPCLKIMFVSATCALVSIRLRAQS
jgi:hypothetical protein